MNVKTREIRNEIMLFESQTPMQLRYVSEARRPQPQSNLDLKSNLHSAPRAFPLRHVANVAGFSFGLELNQTWRQQLCCVYPCG